MSGDAFIGGPTSHHQPWQGQSWALDWCMDLLQDQARRHELVSPRWFRQRWFRPAGFAGGWFPWR
eukprot:7481613-Pyramimonas_sp.AAC.1